MKIPFISAAQEALLRRYLRSAVLREQMWFLIVGGSGAVLSIILNRLFTVSGVRPSLSLPLTLIILAPPVYYCQHRLTFRSDANHLSAFPRYFGAQVFGILIAMGVAEIVPATIKAYPTISYTVITFMVAVVNYGVLKFWAFRDHSAPVA